MARSTGKRYQVKLELLDTASLRDLQRLFRESRPRKADGRPQRADLPLALSPPAQHDFLVHRSITTSDNI